MHIYVCNFNLLILRKWANKLRDFTETLIVNKFTQKLLFIPNADQQFPKSWWKCFDRSNKSNGFDEIYQDALFALFAKQRKCRFLIDKLNSEGTSKTFDNKM